MNRQEIEEEASERHMHERPREPFFSSSNIVSIGVATVINAVLVAFSYGTLFQKVDGLDDAVRGLQQRDITPGAERRISVLEVQFAQQRADQADWKREIRDQLDRIEAKVDLYVTAGRK